MLIVSMRKHEAEHIGGLQFAWVGDIPPAVHKLTANAARRGRPVNGERRGVD
jgi:hypothetical protein